MTRLAAASLRRIHLLPAVATLLSACTEPAASTPEATASAGSAGASSEGGAAGSGAKPGQSEDTAGGAAGSAGAPAVALEGCWGDERTRGFADGSEQSRPLRFTYDAAARILTRAEVEAPSPDAPVTSALHYRVDDMGWMITYAGDGFRHDHQRDEHHNVTHFNFVYEAWTDLTQPTTGASYMSYTATHTYTPDGRLQTTTHMADGVVTTFRYSHDEAGRCAEIASEGERSTTQVLTYEDGRLHTVTNTGPSAVDGSAHRVATLYTYDDAGRIVAIEQDGGGHWDAAADGTPDLVDYWTYSADGTSSRDSRDYTTDIPNDVVEGRSCARSVTTFSPGCVELVAQIPVPVAFECHFSPTRTIPLLP